MAGFPGQVRCGAARGSEAGLGRIEAGWPGAAPPDRALLPSAGLPRRGPGRALLRRPLWRRRSPRAALRSAPGGTLRRSRSWR